MAVVVRGIDGIERSSVAVVVSDNYGIERISVPAWLSHADAQGGRRMTGRAL